MFGTRWKVTTPATDMLDVLIHFNITERNELVVQVVFQYWQHYYTYTLLIYMYMYIYIYIERERDR